MARSIRLSLVTCCFAAVIQHKNSLRANGVSDSQVCYLGELQQLLEICRRLKMAYARGKLAGHGVTAVSGRTANPFDTRSRSSQLTRTAARRRAAATYAAS